MLILQVKWSVYQFYLPPTFSMFFSSSLTQMVFIDMTTTAHATYARPHHADGDREKIPPLILYRNFHSSSTGEREKVQSQTFLETIGNTKICITSCWVHSVAGAFVVLNPAKVKFSPYLSHTRRSAHSERIQFNVFSLFFLYSTPFLYFMGYAHNRTLRSIGSKC